MELLGLPVVMVEKILSCLSYDEIAKDRVVCKDFDAICQRLLNRGFMMIERRIAASLKAVKTQLPRRESERRYHPFAKHCDILTSVETRISMLTMTYNKFIDHGTCCFIPGKVIDEIEKVLLIVETSPTLPRAHEVLQELRDISSMAIEHFDDKISPALRKKLHEGEVASAMTANTNLARAGPTVGMPGLLGSATVATDIHSALHAEFSAIKQRCWLNRRSSVQLSVRCDKLAKKLRAYKKLAIAQARQLKEVALWKADHDQNMAELKRRIEECDMRYSELTHQAVAKAIIEPTQASTRPTHQPLRNFSSQIKLDLSVLPIGSAKAKMQGSNIQPRKTYATSPRADRTEPVSLPGFKKIDISIERSNSMDSPSGTARFALTAKRPFSRLGKRSNSESATSSNNSYDWLKIFGDAKRLKNNLESIISTTPKNDNP